MTRIVVIDPQPAVRAGLAMLLRTEPGLVPVGAAEVPTTASSWSTRQRPDVVLLDPQLLDGDGLGACRRLRALDPAPRVVLYTAGGRPVAAGHGARRRRRRAGRQGRAAPRSSSRRSGVVARGGSALPPLDREQLDAAAHRVDAEDLALLAMLVDRTEPAEVAATLRLDRRRMARRIERAARPPARARRRARTPGLTSYSLGAHASRPHGHRAHRPRRARVRHLLAAAQRADHLPRLGRSTTRSRT